MNDIETKLRNLAKEIMECNDLETNIEKLRSFADNCWNEGAVEAQNDAARYIRDHCECGG